MADQPHDEKYAYVGKDLGSKEFLTTDAIMENYFNGLGVDHSYYFAGSVYDQKVAPTMTLTEIYGIEEARMPNNFGNLWMRQEW